VVSLLLCCTGINGLVSIPLGLVSMRRIKRQPEVYTGRGLAIAGVVMGIVCILMTLVFWAFMIHRYYSVKPVAEKATFHIQQEEIEKAKCYFVRGLREDPEFDKELSQVQRYLSRHGKLVKLKTGYGMQVNPGVTTVQFKGVFESGTARLSCVFVKEEGEWRLIGYNVR
jgi:hypothetical protein